MKRVHDDPCKECGGQIELCYDSTRNGKLILSGLCFTCDFWTNKTKSSVMDDPRTARIDGQHLYIMAGETDSLGFQGHAGREFCIKFFDGRIETTRNLWSQGTIPEHFRDRLSDNAAFIRPDAG